MESWLLVIMVLCVVVILLAVVAKSAKPSFSGPWPFYVMRSLTSPEQVLYWRLVKAMPDNIGAGAGAAFAFPGSEEGPSFL